MSLVTHPDSWSEITLGEINQYHSKNVQPKDFPEESFELWSVPIFPTGKPETLVGTEIGSSKQAVEPRDVLICKINPRINRVWEVGQKSNYRQIASSEWIVVRQPLMEPRYLLRFFQSDQFRAKLCADVTGVGGSLTRAQPKKVATFPVVVPPLAEQKVIANKLDTLLAQVENTKARLERIPQILKRFRQSVLAAAVSGRLTEDWRVPHDLEEGSWSAIPLKSIAEVLDPNPSHRYPKPESGGIPILSTQQFDGYSGWTTDKAKHVSRDFFDERKGRCGFYEDDIIFARKGRLGLARFAPKGFDYVYSHTVFIVRPYKNVNPAFLLWSLRPDSVVDYLLMAMNSNTGVPTLGKGVFEKMEVNVPSPEEQTEIVRRVDQLFAHADRIEQQVNNALARVNNLTQSILAKAFRGELTEQWRKDNPELISGENSAEALLERIKAERAAAVKPKRRKTKA